MNTWIFQANPDRFNLDSFLDRGPDETLWLVTRHADQMAEEDRVFIWRAAGKNAAVSGIIAEARIIEAPRLQPDDPASLPYWKSDEDGSRLALRTRMRFVKVANDKAVLRRKWFEEDPVLNELTILKMANNTNYLIPEGQARRLNDMWRVTGIDWTRSESIAGLWAYYKTKNIPVSKKADQPISIVALKTGRVVSGVYNKVLNFRYIDPSDSRDGLSGAGATDRAVWKEFSAGDGTLDTQKLEAEFARLWGDPEAVESLATAASDRIARASEVERLTKMPLDRLWAKLNARKTSKPGGTENTAKKRSNLIQVFERDSLIAAIAKVAAGSKCEVPACPHPRFKDLTGEFYCEIHHILPLADGGPDSLSNLICLCPAHHIEAHLGLSKSDLALLFAGIRAEHPLKPTKSS